MLVLGRARDARGGLWIRARLPARRAQTGWLARSALAGYEEVHTRLIVDRARLTLTLLRNGRAVFRAPVGIGRAAHPHSGGRLLRPRPPAALRQPVLRARRLRHQRAVRDADRLARRRLRRDPRDQPSPSSFPGRVSHGCIRLRNADILRLARLLPVGTPLEIR